MARGAIALFETPEGRNLLERHCRTVGLTISDLQQLVEEVIDKNSLVRRRGLRLFFDEFLDRLSHTETSNDAPPAN